MSGIRLVGPILVETHEQVLFAPGGQVRSWAREVSRSLKSNALFTTPINKRPNKFRGQPGDLRRSLSVSVRSRGALELLIDLSASASYALYVHEGTRSQYRRVEGGRFAPKSGGFPLPANPGYGGFKRVQRISGQRPQPFLTDALAYTGVEHPAIRGSVGLPQLRTF